MHDRDDEGNDYPGLTRLPKICRQRSSTVISSATRSEIIETIETRVRMHSAREEDIYAPQRREGGRIRAQPATRQLADIGGNRSMPVLKRMSERDLKVRLVQWRQGYHSGESIQSSRGN